MYRTGEKFPIDDVRAATAAHVREQADGRIELHVAQRAVAKAIGYDKYHHGSTAVEYDADRRFEGQVYRTLNKMADRGELIKTGTGPGTLIYYTPPAYRAKLADDARQIAEDEAIRERWAIVHDTLAAWGMVNRNARYTGDDPRGRPVKLGLEDMEALVARAKRGSES